MSKARCRVKSTFQFVASSPHASQSRSDGTASRTVDKRAASSVDTE
jgi:hypothetical protein